MCSLPFQNQYSIAKEQRQGRNGLTFFVCFFRQSSTPRVTYHSMFVGEVANILLSTCSKNLEKEISFSTSSSKEVLVIF